MNNEIPKNIDIKKLLGQLEITRQNIETLEQMKNQIQSDLDNNYKNIRDKSSPIIDYQNKTKALLEYFKETIDEQFLMLGMKPTKKISFFKKLILTNVAANPEAEKQRAYAYFEIIKRDMESLADLRITPPEEAEIGKAKQFFSSDNSPYKGIFGQVRDRRKKGEVRIGAVRGDLNALYSKQSGLENNKNELQEKIIEEQKKSKEITSILSNFANPVKEQNVNSNSGMRK